MSQNKELGEGTRPLSKQKQAAFPHLLSTSGAGPRDGTALGLRLPELQPLLPLSLTHN